MFDRVQAIRRAVCWEEKGYIFDPNSMSVEEMDKKVKDIDRARYWKDKGYDFDPNLVTAQEMDKRAKELDEAKHWEKLGYYYDPNSQKVFLSKDKRTELSSLAGIHTGSTYTIPNFRTSTTYQNAPNLPRMRTNPVSNGSFYPNTGGGHWVSRNIDSGRFIQLEDDSLWQVEPLDHTTSWLWLYLTDVSVTESQDVFYPYLLVNTEDGEVVKAKLIAR